MVDFASAATAMRDPLFITLLVLGLGALLAHFLYRRHALAKPITRVVALAVLTVVLLRAGAFTLDYVVAGSSKVRTLILTDEQFQQATSGQKPKPPFLMDVALQGTGSQSLRLSKGTYHIVYMGDAAAQMSYRAWWKDE